MKSGYDSNRDELAEARERFGEEWWALRDSMRLEVGAEPRWSVHKVWPVLALVAGFALGAGAWWRRSRSRRGTSPSSDA